MTLEVLCDRFISEYAEKHRRSWKRDRARFSLAGTGYRELWKKRISEVIPADLVALHNKLTAANGAVTANRTIEAIRAAWNWTRSMRYHALVENPAEVVKRNREYSRERYLKPNEIVSSSRHCVRNHDATGATTLPWCWRWDAGRGSCDGQVG